MKRKTKNQDEIRKFLTRIDESKIEITEKKDTVPSVIQNPSAQQIYAELEKSVCTLFFYKFTDGRHRKMRCTLNQEMFSTKYSSSRTLKSAIIANFARGKHGKEGLVPVWDLDAHEWRSFYVDRVYKLVRNEKTDIE